MQVLLRCLLWIMIAALPLQGSAAVFAACKAQAPAPHACHEMADAVHAAAPDDHHATPHGKCSNCASCCTAATAPPMALLACAPFPRAGRVLPVTEPALATVVPAGLERPPRAA